MSERTYQTVQPKYVAACWILSRRVSGETGEETTGETCGTTSDDDIHAIPQRLYSNSTIQRQRPAMQVTPLDTSSTNCEDLSTKYIIAHLTNPADYTLPAFRSFQ